MQPIHPSVFPFDGDRPGVTNVVEHAENVFPTRVAMASRNEVPPASRVRPLQMRSERAVAAVVHPDLGVLAVHVVDHIAEIPQEADIVQALPDHVGGIEVETEAWPMINGLQRGNRGPVVVRDLAGMYLVGEADPYFIENVDDRVPPVGEVGVARLDDLVLDGRKHRRVMPNRRSGEPDDGVDAKRSGGACRGPQLFGGTLPYTLRVTITPDPWVDHVLVAIVDDRFAHRLTIEVVRDRPTAEPMFLQNVLATPDIPVIFGSFCDVEMITPAGDLQSVVAPFRSESAHLLERQIGPLSREQRDRSRLGRIGLPGGFLQKAGIIDHRILLVGLDLNRSRAILRYRTVASVASWYPQHVTVWSVDNPGEDEEQVGQPVEIGDRQCV